MKFEDIAGKVRLDAWGLKEAIHSRGAEIISSVEPFNLPENPVKRLV